MLMANFCATAPLDGAATQTHTASVMVAKTSVSPKLMGTMMMTTQLQGQRTNNRVGPKTSGRVVSPSR